ncbi:MAG: zinc ABC transporter substrate-binding protein [Spirochaetales bacterium]|nr:zinc ABC transporter substrate-binding protein [Spirochaetales bacterium]
MKSNFFVLFFLTLSSLLQAAGGQDSSESTGGKPLVFTANYPLYYLCLSYAGDSVEMIWPFDEGEDPAFWEPEDEDIRILQGADLLILNGAGYDKWLEYSFIDTGKTVDSSRRFRDTFIETDRSGSHSHGGGDIHDHGGTAFTLWLDLSQYSRQAEEVHKALVKLLPRDEETLKERHRVMSDRIEALDRDFRAAAEQYEDTPLLGSHPVYQYFARAYNLEIHSLLLEPDVYPSEKDWKDLAQMKALYGADLMIWEGEPLPETRSTLEEMGIGWFVISPGFNMPEEGDFMGLLEKNLRALKNRGTGQ